MNDPKIRRRIAALLSACTLALVLTVPVSAAKLSEGESLPAAVASFSKNGSPSEIITFSADDFRVTGDETAVLDSLIINSLPAQEAGVLMMGDQLLVSGDIVAASALTGMRFYPLSSPTQAATTFSFTPVFSSGEAGEQVEVNLYLLTAKNSAPIAENLEFTTYKNVAYTGQLSATDPEGDLLTFQLVDKPARGAVTMPEDGSTEFVYTPYENKTGKDSFTYVAVDTVGNVSQQATVMLKIEKPSTKVKYADMDGHPAYNAAIRLAEEGIYIGASMDGSYYFQPDLPVTRSEFLTLAMTTVGLDALEGVTTTGFFDDDMIQTWAKPYISSALRSGAIQGSVTGSGQVVFRSEDVITSAEAAVLLDRLLAITDVPEDTWSAGAQTAPSWASQAVMNLETVGILSSDRSTLQSELTRAETAQMLASALDVLELRQTQSTFLNW